MVNHGAFLPSGSEKPNVGAIFIYVYIYILRNKVGIVYMLGASGVEALILMSQC